MSAHQHHIDTFTHVSLQYLASDPQLHCPGVKQFEVLLLPVHVIQLGHADVRSTATFSNTRLYCMWKLSTSDQRF